MIHRRVHVRIECDGFSDGDQIEVHELTGTEGISRLFDFEVVLVCRDPDGLDAEDLLTRKVTLIFEDTSREDEAPVELRRLHGIVAEVRDLLSSEAYSTYKLRVVPRFWLSSLVETLDIFIDRSVPDILRDKLAALHLVEGTDYELFLVDKYPERDFVVQYKETDFAFISRLIEHIGVAYYIDHRDDRDVIVFCDHNRCFGTLPGDAPVHFAPRGERIDVFRLEVASRVVPRTYVQRDYNYRNPSVDLTGKSELTGALSGGVVEYGGHFKNEDEGKWLSEIRAQERNAERRIFEGSSDLARLGAGLQITLAGHPRGERRLLLTEVRHHAKQTTLLGGGADDASGYTNELRAILATTAYRPARVTPRPRISGMVTAIVDASNKGQYAELDDQGRYRVKFMFDTSGVGEGKASSLVRMMQPHAGAGYGMHFPLRPGVEVLITFMDGDPDRPIIAGTVPNPQTGSPITADNATKNIIRTGGGNEIAIDDKKDFHRIKMSTPSSSTTFQLGAPNDPEQGAMLSTLGASTTVATTGLSAAGAFKSAISLVNDYSASGDITTIAKKPGLEALFTVVVGVIDALVTAVATTVTAVEVGMAATEKGSNQTATKATEAATKAQKACQACRAAALAALPASKATDLATMLAKCSNCTGAAHPAPQAGKTCSLSAADQASLAKLQAYEAKRAAAATYSAAVDAADALHDTAMLKRYVQSLAITNASTQSEDMHDTAAGVRVTVTTADYEAAYAAYTAAQATATAAKSAATATYAGGNEFAAYDTLMADCNTKSCDGVDALRTIAQAKNKEYNDLVTAHGPHKNACKEAKTYLGVWAAVPPLYSLGMFIYSKLKKTQKSVEAIALWANAATELTAAMPRPMLAATSYTVVPSSPQHVIGANGSTHVYGVSDLLLTGEKTVILGIGVMADPTGTAQIPDPSKGRVAVIGGEEVRLASKGEIDIAAAQKTSLSAEHVDVAADEDVKLTTRLHTFAAQRVPRLGSTSLAKLVLEAAASNLGTAELSTDGGQSLKLTQAAAATGCKIAATTPGDFTVDAGPKIHLEAATEIKLSIKNGGPSITMDANGITLKMGAQAELTLKDDRVYMKLGDASMCKVGQRDAVLNWRTSKLTLSSAGPELKGTKVKSD